MLVPNLLITNFCNQNCDFCFAKKEMESASIKREMNLDDLRRILLRMKKIKSINTVKLLGGEPLLHTQFKEIIKLSLKYFPSVRIFTNGIFSNEKAEFLKHYLPEVKFTFNVSTPGFQNNKKVREVISKRIIEFGLKTEVTLSHTINPNIDISNLRNLQDIIKHVFVFRIGISNPIFGEKNNYSYNDFKKIGKQTTDLIGYVKNLNPKIKVNLNCGFTPCMFTETQLKYLKERKIQFSGWSCFGKNSSMDIAVDMIAFHCFPLSNSYRLSMKNNSLKKINGKFILKRYEYFKKIIINQCQKCRLYGYGFNKCLGPCVAFRLNHVK